MSKLVRVMPQCGLFGAPLRDSKTPRRVPSLSSSSPSIRPTEPPPPRYTSPLGKPAPGPPTRDPREIYPFAPMPNAFNRVELQRSKYGPCIEGFLPFARLSRDTFRGWHECLEPFAFSYVLKRGDRIDLRLNHSRVVIDSTHAGLRFEERPEGLRFSATRPDRLLVDYLTEIGVGGLSLHVGQAEFSEYPEHAVRVFHRFNSLPELSVCTAETGSAWDTGYVSIFT